MGSSSRMPDIEYIVRALICANDAVLVCQTRPDGHFFLPGGHVEEGETSHDTLKRELQEELNREVVAARAVQTIDNEYERDGDWIQERFDIMLARLDLHDNVESQEGHICFRWVPIEELERYDFKPPHIIPDLVAIAKLYKSFWL